MTVVLCGVGADTGNVRPVPAVDADGHFEYVPIPEKGPTSETQTFGTTTRRDGDGSLAAHIDAVRPGSSGEWSSESAAVAAHPLHHDPNLDALTYGEHRPAYVAELATLDPGDVVAFYAGFRGPHTDYKHRYLFGYFTVAAEPTVLTPDMDQARKREVLAAHPANAHAKRFAGNGDLYYHDPSFTDRQEAVVIVPGREPGGLLETAIKLSDERRGPNYYMRDDIAETLRPKSRTSHGVHLGGIKPAIRCDVDPATFQAFLDRRTGSAAD